MKKKVKRSFAIHHWCGLIAGAFLLAISLTGAMLVFDDDIDSVVFEHHKQLSRTASAVLFDQSYEKIRVAHPGWEIRVPEMPASADRTILYELRQGKLRQWLFVHPETGEVLSHIDRADLRFTNIVLNIHYNLLSGLTGKVIVLLVGIALLLSTITGVILYRKSIAKVLLLKQKIVFSSSRAMFSSLHRVVGVWGLAFNLLMCISGIWLACLVLNSALTKKSTIAETPSLSYSIDKVIQQTRDSFPEFEINYLKFPATTQGKLQLLGRLKSDPVYYGANYSGVQIDASGKIGTVLFLKDQPLLPRFLRILQALHFGDYAGLVVKIIYVIGGLLPGFLSVTGFFLWRKRHKPDAAQAILTRKVVADTPF